MPAKAKPPFARALRRLRQERGLSQDQLAVAAGLAGSMVGHLEAGTRGPSWETVLKLARALGVSVEVFDEN